MSAHAKTQAVIMMSAAILTLPALWDDDRGRGAPFQIGLVQEQAVGGAEGRKDPRENCCWQKLNELNEWEQS